MRNKLLYTLGVLLGSMTLLMVIGVGFGRAQTKPVAAPNADSFVNEFCFDGKIPEMDVSDLVDVYTKETNDYFNDKIRNIMTRVHENVPTPSLEDYNTKGGAICQDNNGRESADMTCQSIAVCNPKSSSEATNPSRHPYCLAVTLMGVPPTKIANYNYGRLKEIKALKYSYFCYKAALDLKRNAVYDSTPQGILAKCGTGSQYAKKDVCDLKNQIDNEKDPKKKAELERKLSGKLSSFGWGAMAQGLATRAAANLIDFNDSARARIKFIDEEVKRAKIALDQALDAYSQLKSAWQMHVGYADIFAGLVKYRDHLVSIRKQTDAFPFRFINASTTKCL